MPRQKKTKGICDHQTNIASNVKGPVLRRNRERRISGQLKLVKIKYPVIITLNVNGLHAPMKRHGVAEWLRKHDPLVCCLQETHLRTKYIHMLKVKGWRKIFHAHPFWLEVFLLRNQLTALWELHCR